MAAVTRITPARPTMPPGYEDVAAGILLAGEDLEAGDLVYLDGADGWKLATSTEAIAGTQLGFAAQDYDLGMNNCSILLRGEMYYGSGMTPGAPLFPGAVAGDLDDAAYELAVGVDAPAMIHAATASTIRFAF